MSNKLLSVCFEDFITNFPELVHSMHITTHGKSLFDINPYHMEGDVWTHTVACYSYLKTISDDSLSELDWIILCFSVLFHDCGKPNYVQLNKNNKRCFYNHEKESVRVIIRNINTLSSTLRKYVSLDDIAYLIEGIMLLVNAHNVYYQLKKDNKHDRILGYLNYNKNYYDVFKYLIKADAHGQIRKFTQDMYNDKTVGFPEFVEYTKELSQPTVIVLSGLPASGKDTYVSNLFNDSDLYTLSFDDIRMSLFMNNNDYDKNLTFNEIYKLAYEYCNRENINLKNIIDESIPITLNKYGVAIISNTNTTTKARKRWINVIRQKVPNCTFQCWCKIVSLDVCIERDKNRIYENKGKVVGENVINNMLNVFTLPTMAEGFDNIKYIIDNLEDI